MDADAADTVAFDAPGYFRFYKSGKIERLNQSPILPAGVDEATGVTSKDVVLNADTGLTVRLYLPNLQEKPSAKLPVLVYFHGGSFLIGSAKDATYHTYVNALAAAAGVLAVSVDYRLAPEHPLPAAYDDSWAALRWAASAQDGWIAEHGDLSRLFLAGDSAGANIVHDMLMRAADSGGPNVEGAILLHPWFCGSTPIEREPPAWWRRRRPEDEPAGAGRAGAGQARVREDARDRGAGGRARRAEPRVPRRRGRQLVERQRGLARVRRGGSRLLPPEARVRERQAAHGPHRRVHSRCLIDGVDLWMSE